MKNLESINSEKFNESKIGRIEMGQIRGGAMPTCTGGGFRNRWAHDGSGSYVLLSTYSWDSDLETEDGGIMYEGDHLEHF